MSLRYDIYGNITNTKLTQEDKTFSYNTLEYTPQNNLYYVKARYYDPSLSSFISKDTYLGNIYKPITTNRYAYCSGDPVNNMDLDGHKITNNKEAKAAGYNNYKDYLDAQKYYNKQSNGGKKTSNNVTPSGAYTSDDFDGGSSYHYVPPPPDPRQYYRSLVIGPYVYNTNSHDYISNQLNKKQSIKELVTSNSGGYGAGNYSMLYASTAINLSKAQTELVSNNARIDLFGLPVNKNAANYNTIIRKNPTYQCDTFFGGYEEGVKISSTSGDTSKQISTYTVTTTTDTNFLSIDYIHNVNTKSGTIYKGDDFSIGLETGAGNVKISLSSKEYHSSVTFGNEVGYSYGDKYTTHYREMNLDKLTVGSEITDNNGDTLYSEYYLNTVNTALSTVIVCCAPTMVKELAIYLDLIVDALKDVFIGPQPIPVP